MNAVAFKTKDGLYCVAPASADCHYSIRRLALPPPSASKWPSWTDIDPGELCDIITREYRRNGEKYQGFPVFEEV